MNKKIIIIPIIIILTLYVITFIQKEAYKVLKIDTPTSVYIDLNKNHIFDEKMPVAVSDFEYINENTDYDKYPLLKQLTKEQKLFLNYFAKEYSIFLLNNRHVKYQNDTLYIQNKKYSDLMLESKYVFNDDEETQKTLLDNINSINLDEYVIYNPRSKKYHKLACEEGSKLKNFKIIKKSSLKEDMESCKVCHNLIKINFTKPNVSNNDLKQINDVFTQDNIKIFFIDLNKTMKPSNKCDNTACIALKNEINKAKVTIDFAIYGINNQPEIIKALTSAKNRGVKIRWIYDVNKSNNNYYEDNEKLSKILSDYKTDEEYEQNNQSAIMHNKFFIFDNQKVWTGSSNITSTDLSNFNANYSVLINSNELAKKYTEEFEQMYDGNFHKYKKDFGSSYILINNETKIKPMFSPQQNIINTELIPIIRNAKSYIYIPVFFITNKNLANELINAYNRGVEIKVIHDSTNSHANNTTHKILRAAGIKVKTENYAGKIHSKTMIVDDEITVIGSMNFTNSGNNRNDENVLIIKDKDIAKYVKSTFLYLWNKIPEKYEHFDPRAESFESIGSCFDGIDNNFDNKIDLQDEGCMNK